MSLKIKGTYRPTEILSVHVHSPVFKEILQKEKNLNQIIYLKGIYSTEIESIVQFIYLGEATVKGRARTSSTS